MAKGDIKELELASNNTIASPMSKSNVAINLFNFHFLKKQKNTEDFIKLVPKNILLEQYLIENDIFITELLNTSGDYRWSHKFLVKLLQEYLNVESDIKKLQTIEALKYISKLNNELIDYLKIIFLINHNNQCPTKKDFMEKLPIIFAYELSNTLKGITNISEYINYLVSIGIMRDTAPSFGIDYDFNTRIAFHIWCKYKIKGDEERKSLQKEVKILSEENKDFKLLANFIYDNKLHRFDLTEIGLILCNCLFL